MVDGAPPVDNKTRLHHIGGNDGRLWQGELFVLQPKRVKQCICHNSRILLLNQKPAALSLPDFLSQRIGRSQGNGPLSANKKRRNLCDIDSIPQKIGAFQGDEDGLDRNIIPCLK